MSPNSGSDGLTEASRSVGIALSDADRDDRVRVLRVSGRQQLIRRLATLGIVPGVILTIVKPHGPAIVSLGGARIAIGQNAAESVQVEVVDR